MPFSKSLKLTISVTRIKGVKTQEGPGARAAAKAGANHGGARAGIRHVKQ